MKSEMGKEARAELRRRDEYEIKNTDRIKPEFVSEPLIQAKENEMLRREKA